MAGRARAIGFLAGSAISGIIGAMVFLAAAEVVALLVARESSPLLTVGSFVIDVVPRPLKEFAIETFGEYDKIVLLGTLALAVVAASAVAGILQWIRPPLGVVVFVIAGVLAVAATVTRADAGPFSWLGAVVGTAAGATILTLLVRRLRRWHAASSGAAVPDGDPESADSASPAPIGRRGFLTMAGIAAASAVLVGVGSRVAAGATSSIQAVRRALRLPAPRRVVQIPAGADLGIPGLSPLITPNRDFYRVDTALVVPSVDPGSWRLRIDGMVQTPVELGFDELVSMGLDEYAITMTCVSNEVGGQLLGNAVWLGVPVRDLLSRANPLAGADMVLSRSVDGFTASTPLESLTDDALDAILAVGMNGEPLPLEHGFPVRMVVPGLYGYVSATKWLTQLTVTTFAADEAYWTPRGYSERAPIKMSSRIDTPGSGASIPAGTTVVAGVAWAQPVGVARVEVTFDDGAWREATLSTPLNDSTWVQWHLEWEATAGTHFIAVRATDRNGMVQVQERAPIAPDGSTGWQRTLITVT